MIEYLKEMYSTPTVMWTFGQKMVSLVIVLSVLAVVFGIVLLISYIRTKMIERAYRKYKEENEELENDK